MIKINRSHKKRRSQLSSYIAISLTIILVLNAWLERNGTKELTNAENFTFKSVSASIATSASVEGNFETLDKWSDSLLDKEHIGAKWLIRWEMDITKENMEKLAQRIYIDEHKNMLNKVISQNGTYISGVIPNHNGSLTIQRVFDEIGDDKVIVLLQLEHDPTKTKVLKDFIKNADKSILSLADEITVSIKVTGAMQEDAMKRIKQVTHSSIVEEYKDASMKVVTAYSSKLKNSYWLTENKMVNLQYATYADKNTENSILTLAIPLISGEFGEFSAN